MIASVDFPWSWESVGRPEQWLAIIGGAALGAFAAGVVAQLLTKVLTGKKMPRFGLFVVRGLGAVAAGILVAMWVWTGGGWGPGGRGPGPGDGPDKKGDSTQAGNDGTTDKDKQSKEQGPPPLADGREMKVEVLSNEAVKGRLGQTGVDQEKFYRVAGRADDDLMTLKDLTAELSKLKGGQPPLKRINVDIQRVGGPSMLTDRVEKLYDWADENHVAVYPPLKKGKGSEARGPGG